jgi:hypothetical protein
MIDVSGHVHAAWGMCYGLTEPTMTFDQHIAAFALGRVRTSDLPIVAVEALDEGYDCIELAMLAGSTPTEQSWSEAEELWRRALRRLNKAVPGRAEAGRVLRQYYAGLVSSGSLAPRTAAAEIVRLTMICPTSSRTENTWEMALASRDCWDCITRTMMCRMGTSEPMTRSTTR